MDPDVRHVPEVLAVRVGLLGTILIDREKFNEAETSLRKAFAIHRRLTGDLHHTTANTAMNLSRVLMRRKAYNDAEDCLRLALNAERTEEELDDMRRQLSTP